MEGRYKYYKARRKGKHEQFRRHVVRGLVESSAGRKKKKRKKEKKRKKKKE